MPLTRSFSTWAGSFRSITQLFGGAYLKVSAERAEFTINPFSLEPSRENLNFLFSLIKVLAEGAV